MIIVTYIEHSGFFVELSDKALLFDYFKGKIPETDKPLYIFSSHRHKDHFNKKIFDIKSEKIILSNDIRAVPTINTVKIGPNKETDIDGLRIKTLRSTDEGVAFIIEYNGVVIYHAGDLNDWYWKGEDEKQNENMTKSYRRIILKGFSEIPKVDIAFLPVDPRLEEYCGRGADFFLDNVRAEHIFPMHFWGGYKTVGDYIKTRKENIYNITKAPQVFEIQEKGANV